ncbi:YihY/virulence factor BrkB family protein [Alloalcanivorax mobilis]|uniref:YihY/virulence factor BrkB family protein n=1 Tax=Alloalcanivorax mobilis TaxID=2019569 RepID=UPI000B5B17EC|nr:YihY/virulence factor BrkB family protein [Alloalcanivorax mobilis]ASK36237.1 ribonuclease BN [Alcanivorax sp. N3-2A]|tara:strand:- start:1329 stop:2231 length:903 start_codon:yes stop_codon:yes gene_type:complete
MKEKALYWFGVVKTAITLWLDRSAIIYAGALAFFTLFSIAPVVILAVQVIGLVISTDTAMTQIMEQLTATVGPDAARAVAEAVQRTQLDRSGIVPTLIGLGAMIVGATTVFAQMQRSLNNIWDIAPKPTRNTILALLKSRLTSLTVVLSIGFVLLVSLFLSVVLQSIMVFAQDWLPVPGGLAVALETLISVAVVTLLFATIFRVLPDARLSFRDVFSGALVTALLFIVGRFLIALYLSHTATASTYGAAGSLVLLLLWVYYSSLILLFGAAFTRAHTEARGIHIRPNRTAVRVHKSLMED